ncbi:MAG: fructose-6-phosphate aldolase [Sphingomonadales bacterium]|nr:fructose-6-phosphate aldolase [Sphingomonadales bacterium]
MKFFADTAVLDEIRDLNSKGLLDGVTTNPSLVKKAGGDFFGTIKAICDEVDGPVSAEVIATDYDGMLAEAEKLIAIADNICIKLPITWEGIKACKTLSDRGVPVNMTLCFSANQALLAAKAGAAYVSPFVGRLDDIDQDGMVLIEEMRAVFDNYDFGTEILVASIRNADHVTQSAIIGADVATIPAKVLNELINHPLTDKGLAAFLKDWAEVGESIL